MEQVFGRFQTMERIENYPGHFNTGVYRAVDSSTNRLVALQTVWPEDCTVRPDLIARGFPAEVAAAPKLVHPNIAEMIDFGVAGSQGYILYVAYEWVGGRSLRGLLDANARQSLVTAREILSPIAAALDYAHSRGVVHGLLYPGFVWLSDDRTPKVAGFGMANGFAEMAWDCDRCRLPLAYLAPERFYSSGNSRADQFSLAVIAYEMLEGQHPFIDKKESGNAYAIPYSRRWEALCQQSPVRWMKCSRRYLGLYCSRLVGRCTQIPLSGSPRAPNSSRRWGNRARGGKAVLERSKIQIAVGARA